MFEETRRTQPIRTHASWPRLSRHHPYDTTLAQAQHVIHLLCPRPCSRTRRKPLIDSIAGRVCTARHQLQNRRHAGGRVQIEAYIGHSRMLRGRSACVWRKLRARALRQGAAGQYWSTVAMIWTLRDYVQLASDIQWHFIGTLQSNKCKALAGEYARNSCSDLS